ncbi:hypothetical protein GKZ68_06870 [Hymenobacter sp. BRD128]|uniref:hypothetical protein n=1 Tax=Hymenobacter sp. BRD128 TaxID=2675878 RepID=UPI0015679AAD|nr:hypothetical protein [Hymenobacter sp. BRD128]QKG56380.1 hypothetical protein GKZ68_06870 [Hymenobacter sp. BRD128]
MKTTLYNLATCTLLILSQCKEEVAPQLPAETTIGAETFGCKIDGKLLVPHGSWNHPGLGMSYYVDTKGYAYFSVNAADYKASDGGFISITCDSLRLRTGKTYDFKMGGISVIGYGRAGTWFTYLRQYPGELTITKFDSVKHIISGRFDFVGINRDAGKQVLVTDERFDVGF